MDDGRRGLVNRVQSLLERFGEVASRFAYCLQIAMKGAQRSVLKLQVSPSLASSLRDRLSSREVDYTNFYSELLPL